MTSSSDRHYINVFDFASKVKKRTFSIGGEERELSAQEIADIFQIVSEAIRNGTPIDLEFIAEKYGLEGVKQAKKIARISGIKGLKFEGDVPEALPKSVYILLRELVKEKLEKDISEIYQEIDRMLGKLESKTEHLTALLLGKYKEAQKYGIDLSGYLKRIIDSLKSLLLSLQQTYSELEAE